MYNIALPYISSNTSSYPTSLPYDIRSQGPTLVTTSTHRKSINDLPSTLLYSFPSNITSEKPNSDPTSAPSEYLSDGSSCSSLPFDNNLSDPLSPTSMLLTSTTATPMKNPTAYHSIAQNSITVPAIDPITRTFTDHLPSYTTSSWIISAKSVSPPVLPTRVLPTHPSLTPSLLPCADTKDVLSPPPSSPPPPGFRHAYNTWFPIMKPLIFRHDMEFLKEQVVSKGIENRLSTPPIYQAKVTPQQFLILGIF